MNVYVVTHKKFDDSICKEFIPIAVGKNLHNDETCKYIKDNSGDSISEKNANYCELTAQYWIWKNDNKAKVKGLCHYRRYFTKAAFSTSTKHFLTKKDIENILFEKKYDAIVSEYYYSYRGVKKAYLDCGYEKDLDTTRAVVGEKYPEYLENYDKVMNGCCNLLANMIIAPAEVFDEYTKWLLDILFEVEKRTDLTGYTPQEARIYGYISERLLAVWLLKNNKKMKHMRIVNTEEKITVKGYIIEFLKKIHLYQGIKKAVFCIKKDR